MRYTVLKTITISLLFSSLFGQIVGIVSALKRAHHAFKNDFLPRALPHPAYKTSSCGSVRAPVGWGLSSKVVFR